MMLPLAAVPFAMTIVMALWVLTCLALVFIIMIQKGKGGGLSAAFGGGGGSSLFGAKTGDVLTWVTIGVAGGFIFLSVIMGLYYRPTVTMQETTPVTAPAPTQAPAGSQPQPPAQNNTAPQTPTPAEAPVSN